MSLQRELSRSFDAGSEARRALTEWFGTSLDSEQLDEARTVCSELVNNAIVHGRGRIMLSADLDGDRLRIEVIDEGRGFEHVVRRVPFEALSGRGLAIVDAVASRWGIHEGTTHVWADVELPGPRVGEEAKPEK